ncbi:MAG: VapC toxin family PIN domain ribonuclease [Thermoleophilia bacterium]|nr:VapC toxin family PIN domain ribonuclease [Thermoleophilia bacterium]
MTVFVDSSALYALMDALDVDSERAVGTFRELTQTDDLVTHSYVCVEAMALLQQRVGLDALRALVDDVLPVLEIEWVDEALHRAATAACLAAGTQHVSWTSFELMRRRGIARAFAYDDDFEQQGFEVVG